MNNQHRKLRGCTSRGIVHLVLAVAVGACSSDAVAPPALTSSELRASVTAEVASTISSTGQFRLPSGGGDAAGEISEARAKAVALAFWQDQDHLVRPYAEHDRGARIAGADLKPCPRAYYTESAYDAPPAGARRSIVRSTGAQWVVGLCAGREQQVVITVAATAVDLVLAPDAPRLRAWRSGDIMYAGVPQGVEMPVSPELAAVAAAAATGRRLTRAPKLVRRPVPYSGIASVWTLELDAPVRMRGSDRDEGSDESKLVFGYLTDLRSPTLGIIRSDASNASDAEQQRGVFLRRRVSAPAAIVVAAAEGR